MPRSTSPPTSSRSGLDSIVALSVVQARPQARHCVAGAADAGMRHHPRTRRGHRRRVGHVLIGAVTSRAGRYPCCPTGTGSTSTANRAGWRRPRRSGCRTESPARDLDAHAAGRRRRARGAAQPPGHRHHDARRARAARLSHRGVRSRATWSTRWPNIPDTRWNASTRNGGRCSTPCGCANRADLACSC